MGERLEFSLLGPLRVGRLGAQVPVPAGRQRALLAALLLGGGRALATDELIEILWGTRPPASARVSLHNYVKRLRQALGDSGHSRILTWRGGYKIAVVADEFDVSRFEALLRAARAAARAAAWDQAAAAAQAALSLWRGEPLADVESETLAQREVPRLAELRLQALEVRLEADLRLGGHAEAIPELRRLVTAHPLREQLHALLMRALYQGARQAEALAVYRDARVVLIRELGTEPGPGLRDLHQRMLASDPDLDDSVRAVPRALPGAVLHFTGRDDELAALTGLLQQAGPPGTAVISAIGGTAGVGKTALAVHWAHQVAERFPDGQLYVNLRGYDPGPPVQPGDALAGFLRALGVPGDKIPAEADERGTRYRSLLAGRRMLVLIDNAGSVEQVRPLLPAAAGCLALVTSRDSLAGLIARDGAWRLDLDLMPPADAVGLLETLIGARAAAEPGATRALAEHCARLPLALRVAAERASERPETSLAGLVAELADERRRLDLLDAGGDLHTAVRAVFSWSYQHLDKPVARAFRLLGLHPGPDLDPYAAAALTGTAPETAGAMLRGLARAHLIQPARPGHYAMHDLLRAYARELATCEAADDAGTALTRLFDFYLATATTAMDMAFPAERDGQPRVGPPVAGPQLPDPGTARAWLDGELANLVAVVAHAAEHTWSNHATRLAATLYRYLDGGRFAEALAIHSHARLAAHRAGDLAAEAEALTNLGVVDAHQGRYHQASLQLEQSLPLFRTAGHLRGEARALSTLGFIDFQQSRYQQAAAHLRRSLTVHRALADPCGQARALSNLGLIHLRQGRYTQAVGRFQRARTLMAASGNRYGEAHTLSNLGEAELRQGRCGSAACYFQQSLAMFREIGDRPGEAYILSSLGDVELRQGSCERAIAYHRQSMLVFEQASDLAGLAKALNSLGEAFLAHQPAEARTQHAHALGLARQIDDQYEQARAQHGLGHAYHALDDPGRARHHWRLALGLYGSLGTPEAGQIRALLGWQAPRRWSVLEDLDIDDSDSPAIGLVPPGVSWEEVRDHIKIAHSSLLVLPDGSDQYAGAYWTGTEMVVVDDLGPDQDEAVDEFRAYLRERGET